MFSRKKAFAFLLAAGFVFTSCQNFNSRNVAQEYDENDVINKDANPPEAEAPKYFDRLADYIPYKYEVLFTDPVCGVYKYNTEIKSINGKVLTQKPENVFCRNRFDQARSGSRSVSPQFRLVEWINNPKTKEIFFTYLSFSNKTVKNALCEASKRGVKIRFVMSSTENKAAADELLACSPENVQMKGRGMEGELGYAHNKFFIINPQSESEFKIVFSSGNMTSGPVIHHENWNFITTNANSHFAQAHKCAMNAEWDDAIGRSRVTYVDYIRKCRSQIIAPEEKDIKVFFIPGEGEVEPGVTKKTASEYMMNGDGGFPGINNAKKIWLACHRFLYSKMINGLKNRMRFGNKPELRIVADDDTYYKFKDPSYPGDTSPAEWTNMVGLRNQGASVKLMETNAEEHQLHHSKYLIFADADGFKSLFTGSANLTGAGFKTNWENSYYIMIPEVVKAFADHYVHTWNNLASEPGDLPESGIVGTMLTAEPIIAPLQTVTNGENK